MKRILLSTLGTIAGIAALLSFKSHGQPLTPSGGLPSADVTQTQAPQARAPAATGRAKSYTGTAVTTRYGIVQVKVVVSAARLTRVSFTKLTAFDQHSQDINSQAGPVLLQETLKAQSARIDTVSGATYTSDGYRHSLQSAIDEAAHK